VWNLAAGGWAGVLIVAATPVLVGRYGIDGFGVIGLWISLQVVLGVFDLGLSSTLSRELARSKGGAGFSHADVFVTFERAAWCVTLFISLLLIGLGAAGLADRIQSPGLPPDELRLSLGLMATALVVQFPSILYAGGMSGVHQHRVANLIQITINGFRWGGGIVLALTSAPLHDFFLMQVGVAAIQSGSLRFALRRVIEGYDSGRFRVGILRAHFAFAMGMAGTSIVGVVIANTDRLLISQMLSTTDLGRYAVAFVACSVIQMLLVPFYRVFFPRYSQLHGEGNERTLLREYFTSNRWLSGLVVPTVVCMCVFTPEALVVWMGEAEPDTTDIMRLLLIGVGMAALGWLPGAIQQAYGSTTLHLAMLVGALVVGLPVAVLCVNLFGAAGATAVWLVHGALSVLVEPWLMHRRVLRGYVAEWYAVSLVVPLVPAATVALLSSWLLPSGIGRWSLLVWLAVTGGIALAAALAAQSVAIHHAFRGDKT
jgi:O-antigen/teichoic acid export membrane protein